MALPWLTDNSSFFTRTAEIAQNICLQRSAASPSELIRRIYLKMLQQQKGDEADFRPPSALAGTLVQQCSTYFEACICLHSLLLFPTIYIGGCIHPQCQHSGKYLFHHSVKRGLKSLWQKTEKQRNFIVVDVWLSLNFKAC